MPTETLMMKVSNIDWMGDIPNTWQVKRLKYVMDNYDYLRQPIDASQRTQDGDILYDYYGASGVIDKIDDCICEGEKILIGEDGANLKMRTLPLIYIASGKYWVNNHAHILYPKNDNNLHFFAHQMESIDYENFITGSAQPKLSQENLNNVLLIEPPAYEQKAIADFLDEKCEKIDKVIGKIEEQIQVLEDYKKSLITETVTKGLDKNVPMKDSGIDWIGEIPKEWEIKRIKYFTNLNGRIGWQGLTTEDYQDEGPYLITGIDFNNGLIDWNSCTHITEKRWIEANTIQIRNGDLLITKDGTVGKVAVVSGLNDKASLNSGVLLIRPQGNVEYYNRYIYYQLISDVFWAWFEFNKSGNSTIIHLYQQDFANLYTLLPNITEQKQIADYLDKECEKIDKTIKNKKEQLETIKEYKKSLIYEYVTGKKRVAC